MRTWSEVLNSVAFLRDLWKSHKNPIFLRFELPFVSRVRFLFFYPDGKYRIFKFLSLFRLHPVMCAKLLFHTGDWNCQTIEKQWSMVHIYGFFKSLKKKPLNWRNPTSQICSGMRSESKKRTLELSLIQGFSCVKSIYVLSLVVPPGIEPGTQGFSVLCSTNWAMAPCLSLLRLQR